MVVDSTSTDTSRHVDNACIPTRSSPLTPAFISTTALFGGDCSRNAATGARRARRSHVAPHLHTAHNSAATSTDFSPYKPIFGSKSGQNAPLSHLLGEGLGVSGRKSTGRLGDGAMGLGHRDTALGAGACCTLPPAASSAGAAGDCGGGMGG